jgi:hypothetical protein
LVESTFFHKAAPRAKRGVPHRFALGGETTCAHHVLAFLALALLGLHVSSWLIQLFIMRVSFRVVQMCQC